MLLLISYGPTEMALTGHELTVTPAMQAQAFWLVCKYTSLTYVGRMYQLYPEFVRGYEAYARAQNDYNMWYRENLAGFYKYQSALEKGLELIGRGYGTGYRQIRDGLFFADFVQSRRFEYGMENRPIGYRTPPRPHEGLYAWVHAPVVMAGKVHFTLNAAWAFPRLLEPAWGPFGFPTKLDPLPSPTGPRIEPDAEVTVQGVWLPVDVPNGCPNYLIAGEPAPQATRAAERPDFPGGGGTEPVPAYTEYAYATQTTRWALLWEDHRYNGGAVPDESAYLDPSTAPPPWPPAA